jgi:hypothetical protein
MLSSSSPPGQQDNGRLVVLHLAQRDPLAGDLVDSQRPGTADLDKILDHSMAGSQSADQQTKKQAHRRLETKYFFKAMPR